MSKFNTVVENNLNQTSLLKIKILVDPKENKEGDYKNCDEYIGYVLKEDSEGNIVAIVPGMSDDTVDVPAGGFEPMMNDGGCSGSANALLDEFKQLVIQYLLQKGFNHEVISNMERLVSARTTRDVELILKSLSISSGEVLNLYRDYFDEDIV